MSLPHGGGPLQGDTRHQIIASLFNRRGEDGVLDETYIAHLKIWEDPPPSQAQHLPQGNAEDGGAKSRYLLLAVTRHGKVQLHKAKRNTNMTFSKGKTWALQDLRVVEVHNPQSFSLTMTSRTYLWRTERASDQSHFLNTILRIYEKFTQGRRPQLVNFDVNEQHPHESTDVRYASPPSSLAPPAMRDRLGSSSSIASSAMTGDKSFYTTASGSTSRDLSSVGRPSVDSMRNDVFDGASSYGRSTYGNGQPPSMPPHRRGPSQDSTSEYRRPSTSSQADTRSGPRHSPEQSMRSDIPPIPQPTRNQSADSVASYRHGAVGEGTPPALQRSPYRQPGRPLSSEYKGHVRRTSGFGGSDGSSTALQPTIPPPPAPSSSRSAVPSSVDAVPGPSQPPHGLGITVDKGEPVERDEPTPRPSQQRQFLAPIITTTEPSPASSPNPNEQEPSLDRRHIIRRASFHPPPQSTPYSREVLLRGNSFSQADQLLDGEAGEEELEDATMANVEEMLEGFDFGMESGTQHQGTAEAIEARLLDELNALEAANIHAFLETDDRINAVMKQLDEAVQELDDMDSHITGYKMQLNVVTEDITYIESQNKGLQVQTTNQQALLAELERLLQIVQVPEEDLQTLTQESLENERGIQALEAAAASLYQALQAGRDTGDMTAAVERLRDYETRNKQFCLRIIEYLFIMFKFQADLAATSAAKSPDVATGGSILPHDALEEKLGHYCGLVLYIKEMDEERYQKLCASYFSAASELHGKEMKSCLVFHINQVQRPTEDTKDDGTFAGALAASKSGPLQRSRTVVGFRGQDNKKDKRAGNHMKACDALDRALELIAAQIYREEAFIADFLQITDNVITFADYMDLDSYIRRQASRRNAKGMQPATVKLRRSALDLIFGFLGKEIKDWIDGALQRDPIQIFGIIAACERHLAKAQARNATFLVSILERQLQRLQALLDRFVVEQVKIIESTKLTVKKRTGVTFFIRHFPVFAERVESQLVDCDHLNVRRAANAAYEKIVSAMFDTLQQMAKLDRHDAAASDDKDQLNFGIILIENMHFYVADTAKQDMKVKVLASFKERAERLYQENLVAYVKAVLRRSFAKPMDFFDAVSRQLQSSSPAEVAASPAYNKAALKRIIKEAGSAKDMRKAVDALARRVEKHFSIEETDSMNSKLSGIGSISAESAALIRVVWTACGNTLSEDVSAWQDLIANCYPDSGQVLEYSAADVDAAFKKAKPV